MIDPNFKKYHDFYYPRMLVQIANFQRIKNAIIEMKIQTHKGNKDTSEVGLNFEDQKVTVKPDETKFISKVTAIS